MRKFAKIFKKVVALSMSLICAFLFMTISPTAFAAELTVTQSGIPKTMKITGKIILNDGNTIRIRRTDTNKLYDDLILNVTDQTVAIDAVSGNTVIISELKIDDIICAYTSTVMTRSIPPMTTVEAIVVNMPETGFGVPNYIEVKIIETAEDGTIKILDENQAIIATLTDSAELLAYANRSNKVLGLDSIVPGTKMFLWYDVITLSMPGQATPYKVKIMPYQYSFYIEANPEQLIVNGEEISTVKIERPYKDENGILMLPLKKTAEAMGCDVYWNEPGTEINIVGEHINVSVSRELIVVKNGKVFLPYYEMISLLNVKIVGIN